MAQAKEGEMISFINIHIERFVYREKKIMMETLLKQADFNDMSSLSISFIQEKITKDNVSLFSELEKENLFNMPDGFIKLTGYWRVRNYG